MHTTVPEIHIFNRFRPFIEDILPKMLTGYPHKLLAHPDTNKELWQQAPPPVQEKAVLAIGPEGGFIPYEVQKLEACGFTPFSLGERILRVETAVPVLLSQLMQI